MLFDAEVAFLHLLIEGESVLKTGASASRDEHPQLEVGVVFFPDQLAHLAGCSIGKHQYIRRRRRKVRVKCRFRGNAHGISVLGSSCPIKVESRPWDRLLLPPEQALPCGSIYH